MGRLHEGSSGRQLVTGSVARQSRDRSKCVDSDVGNSMAAVARLSCRTSVRHMARVTPARTMRRANPCGWIRTCDDPRTACRSCPPVISRSAVGTCLTPDRRHRRLEEFPSCHARYCQGRLFQESGEGSPRSPRFRWAPLFSSRHRLRPRHPPRAPPAPRTPWWTAAPMSTTPSWAATERPPTPPPTSRARGT